MSGKTVARVASWVTAEAHRRVSGNALGPVEAVGFPGKGFLCFRTVSASSRDLPETSSLFESKSFDV